MDLDGDGYLDLISGSWPGEIYRFPGFEGGIFVTAGKVPGKDGEAINLGSASAPFACDWDRDGDLDLVVGCIEGHVFLVPNESGGRRLQLGAARRVAAAGSEVAAPSGDAGPCIADWDGDGTLDLVLGCGDGSVWFYPNRAREGVPRLDAGIELVSAGSWDLRWGDDGEPSGRGVRAKVCVADWNGDGQPDLLVGDFSCIREIAPEPRVHPAQELEECRARLVELETAREDAVERIRTRVHLRLGMDPGDPFTEEKLKEYEAVWDAVAQEDTAYQDILKVRGRLNARVAELSQPGPSDQTNHGWVWVFLREA